MDSFQLSQLNSYNERQKQKKQIKKPMLAATLKEVNQLDYDKGYMATQKLDGIRALMIDGKLVSRTFKPIRNNHIREILEAILPDGADGEIVCPGAFQATSSGVMRAEGEPEFTYYMFDYVKDDLRRAMLMTGCDSVQEISSEILVT